MKQPDFCSGWMDWLFVVDDCKWLKIDAHLLFRFY
jgi:hypothetical protein